MPLSRFFSFTIFVSNLGNENALFHWFDGRFFIPLIFPRIFLNFFLSLRPFVFSDFLLCFLADFACVFFFVLRSILPFFLCEGPNSLVSFSFVSTYCWLPDRQTTSWWAPPQSPLGRSGGGSQGQVGRSRPGASWLSWHAREPEERRRCVDEKPAWTGVEAEMGLQFCHALWLGPLQHRCPSCQGCVGRTGPLLRPPMWNRISAMLTGWGGAHSSGILHWLLTLPFFRGKKNTFKNILVFLCRSFRYHRLANLDVIIECCCRMYCRRFSGFPLASVVAPSFVAASALVFVASPAVPSDFSFLSHIPVTSHLHWSRSDFPPLAPSVFVVFLSLPVVSCAQSGLVWWMGFRPNQPAHDELDPADHSHGWQLFAAQSGRTTVPSRHCVGTFGTDRSSTFTVTVRSHVWCPFSAVLSSPPTHFAPCFTVSGSPSRTAGVASHSIAAPHRAACSRAEMLGSRGFTVESTVARVCREAGARVSTNLLVRDLDLPVAPDDAWGLGGGRGWPASLRGGAQLAIDTTFVSPVRADGEPRGQCARQDGAALAESSPFEAPDLSRVLRIPGPRETGCAGGRSWRPMVGGRLGPSWGCWREPKRGACPVSWEAVRARFGLLCSLCFLQGGGVEGIWCACGCHTWYGW